MSKGLFFLILALIGLSVCGIACLFAPPYPVAEAALALGTCWGAFILPLLPRLVARQHPEGKWALMGLVGNVFRMFFILLIVFWAFGLDFLNFSVFFPATLAGYFVLLSAEITHLHFSSLTPPGKE